MFITSLPLLFAFTSLINPLEVSCFLIAIMIGVYQITPNAKKRVSLPVAVGLYNYLYAAWTGKLRLRQAFWPFFILANLAFVYIDYRIMNISYTINSWKTVHGMLLLPSLWWTLSIWRCSENTQYRWYACIARSITIYFYIDFILRLILSIFYPETLFDCRLLTIEYGDCN